MYSVWSIRLSTFLFIKIYQSDEDSRYESLKESWRDKSPLYFLILFLVEGGLVFLLALPLDLAVKKYEVLNAYSITLSVLLFITSIVLESVADSQKNQFKKDKNNKGKVCNIGMWRYSRHPNYFFEVLIWLSYGLYFVGTDLLLLASLPAVVIFILLNYITGVPPSERQSLKSRGEKYRKYQQTTSRLIPWWPKNSQKENK